MLKFPITSEMPLSQIEDQRCDENAKYGHGFKSMTASVNGSENSNNV
jgi:hypothetical protein